jgi:PBP1b-binding outer membrane lipoprotein LpoB
MKKTLIISIFLWLTIILSSCTNSNQISKESQNVPPAETPTTEAPPNITPVQDLTNDCSKVDLPKNVERDTKLDIEKKLITVYWLDQTTAEDVGVMYEYTDSNCSESAKEMTNHLLGD